MRSPLLLLLAALLLPAQARAEALTAEEQGQLASALLDQDRPMKVRLEAALLLGRGSGPGAAAALEQALGDPEYPVRAAAALGLGKLGGAEQLDPLLDRLDDPEPFVREQAREALAALARRGQLSALRGRVRRASEGGRAQLVEVAGMLEPSAGEGLLLQLLADPAPAVREPAKAALLGRSPPEVQRVLLAALADPSPPVRAAAARVCGERRISPALPALANMAISPDEAPEGRKAARAALKAMADQLDVERLAAQSAQGSREERELALGQLAAAGGPRAGAALATALEDPEPALRARAALGLAAMGDTASLRRLELMIGKDENAGIRRELQAAAEALRAQR